MLMLVYKKSICTHNVAS